jgi:hypothetical protein
VIYLESKNLETLNSILTCYFKEVLEFRNTNLPQQHASTLINATRHGKKLNVKLSRYRPIVAYRVSRSIALLFLNLDARRGWVVSTTTRPFYPRERPVIHYTGGWVVLRAGLDVCEKSRPTGIRSPDRSARSQSTKHGGYCILPPALT